MKIGIRLSLVSFYFTGLLLLSGIPLFVIAQPVISNIESSTINYTAGDPAVLITNTIRVEARSLTSATISISSGYDPDEDKLIYKGSTKNITASWDKATGVLTLSGYVSGSSYRDALRKIYYENSDPVNPSVKQRSISFTVFLYFVKSNTVFRNINVEPRNEAPVLANLESDPAIFCLNSESIPVTQSITVSDADNTNLVSAVISLSLGYTPNEDKLLYLDQNGITGSWNNETGQLTLTGISSTANYQDALRSIRFSNLNPENDVGSHEITFEINDGIAKSNQVKRSITRIIPTAVMAGDFSICRDDDASIEITFTGSSPWNFSYTRNSGTAISLQGIAANPYILPVSEKGTYTLVSVNDKYCPGKVSGSARVEILPEPDVSINSLKPAYSKESTEMVPLIGIPAGGTFSGPGVVPYNQSWYFLPSLPAPGIVNIVYKYRPDAASCYGYDTISVRIIEKSAAIELQDNRTHFCVNDKPIKVTGINLLNDEPGTFSISGGRGLTDHGDNTATLYLDSLAINQYTVTYTAPDGNPASEIIDVGGPLSANFRWSVECFEPDKQVIFVNASTSPFGYLSPDSYRWTVKLEEDSVLFASRDISYLFPEVGNYEVKLRLVNSYGCTNEIQKIFPLRPVYALAENSYSEDFEGPQQWEKGNDPLAGNSNSWVLGKPNQILNGFSEPFSGENCWFTNITVNPVPAEYSWITSPCFDFRGTEKPTLVARIRRSFTDMRDGANVSYSVDNGQHWNVLGTLHDGIAWYNGYFGNPGTQSEGWTSLIDNNWVETRHILDFIKDERVVQFRLNFLAYGSAIGNKGIAIDDIEILERNRTILVEHFTNSSTEAVEADNLVDDIAGISGSSLIDVQYHTSDPGDPFYSFNPMIPNTRQFYYGLTNIPFSVINGGAHPGQMIDYLNTTLTPSQIGIEALYDSDFDLKVTTMTEGNRLYAEAIITARRDVPLSELSLRMVVIEPLVIDSSVSAEKFAFRNIVRAMLPDAAGKSIYQSWQKGETRRIFEWMDIESGLDINVLKVTAFIQNELNREILQASLSETGLINSVDDPEVAGDFAIFPNPADNILNIEISAPPDNFSVELINSLGKQVYKQRLSHTSRHTINLENLPGGMYILRIMEADGHIRNHKVLISR